MKKTSETQRRTADPGAKSSRVSVCHILSGDNWAGEEVQASTLLRYLKRFPDIDVCAIAMNHGRLEQELRSSGIDVHVIPERRFGFFQILSQAMEFISSKSVSILHSHRYKEDLVAALAVLLCGVPRLVKSQHGLPEYVKSWRAGKQLLLQKLDHLIMWLAADRVISVSRGLTPILERAYRQSRVITIVNGLDLQSVASNLSTAAAKQRLGLRTDSFVVAGVGRLEPVKRLDLFLAAAKEYLQTDSAQFLVVGDGSQRAALEKNTEELRIQEHVRFLGHRTDVYDVLRAVDVFVMTSDHEGLPIGLLEAMWLGIPVLARAVGGIPEVIENKISGLLVHSAEPREIAGALDCLRKDAALRQRLMFAGRARVNDRFSAESMAAQTAQLYRSLAGCGTVTFRTSIPP